MSNSTNMGMGNFQGMPVQEGANQVPPNDPGPQNATSEAIPLPPPGTTVPPVDEASPPDDANPNPRSPISPIPTNLRDFEGRRLYFANVCSTMSPNALHCIFRSYGPIRSFHYDTTLHYGYVVYMERQQALLARYGVDGLILGTRAIRVYYPPYKPRHPTRYCYNCREMGHFIQSCPYANCNSWDYNYAQMYNQGQPVMDYMNHPSSPMMQHFAGHMMPPTSQFMYPSVPVSTIPGQPPGSATLMYQPGWPGPQASAPNIPFMPPYMGSMPQPMNPGHFPMAPMPPQYMNPVPQQMNYNHQFFNQGQSPIQNQTHVQQPQPMNPMPQMIPVNNAMPPQQMNLMPPLMNPVQASAPPLTPIHPTTTYPLPQQPHSQLHPNISAIIQEQATAIIQQHITPMVQQVVNQLMQDPAIHNIQQAMMQDQNMDPPTLQSSSYTVNEEPETASVQSGSMSMQHGSYTAMEEPRNAAMPQNILTQLMQSLPLQDSGSEYAGLGKMMQFAAQALMQDQYGQKNEDAYAKESCSRGRCVHEMEEDMSPRQPNQRSPPVSCCPLHNTPLTRVQKPATTTAQQPTATKTTTMHSGSTSTPRAQQYTAENMTPADQDFPTRQSSSTESIHPNMTEQPMQSIDNQYYPQYPGPPPFSLPSSIFFTLPPIVVNITSPASYMSPAGSTAEPKATFPPPYESLQKNISENYDFMQESERNLREFEEVVRDDEQNYVDNERDLRAEQNNIMAAQMPAATSQPASQPEAPIQVSKGATPKTASSKALFGKRAMKIIRDKEQIATRIEASIMANEQSPSMSDREKQRQDRLKLRAMLLDGNDDDTRAENDAAILPIKAYLESEAAGDNKHIYSELLTTMNTSCSEMENLFSSLSTLVGNPLAKKCLDQIRTKSEADILKLSQQLLQKIVDKDKPADKEEIKRLSNDLLKYANHNLPSTSGEPVCEGAVGGIRNPDEVIESSRSECDSRKDDSDDGNYRRKNNWKKNKKRRR